MLKNKSAVLMSAVPSSDSTISPTLYVDFSKYERDLIQDGLDKMLSVFLNKCTVRKFFIAFIRQVQELYDAALDVEKFRTLYNAEGINLDALGRIVGQPRKTLSYSEEDWFLFDVAGNGFDQMPWWVTGGYLNTAEKATDPRYKELILARIIKNHTLTASVPEILFVVKTMYNLDVSYEKTGPNKVRLIVQDTTSKAQLYNLIHKENNLAVDDDYLISYPATLALEDKVFFVKKEGFYFDRESPHQWDTANWSITA